MFNTDYAGILAVMLVLSGGMTVLAEVTGHLAREELTSGRLPVGRFVLPIMVLSIIGAWLCVGGIVLHMMAFTEPAPGGKFYGWYAAVACWFWALALGFLWILSGWGLKRQLRDYTKERTADVARDTQRLTGR